MFISRGLGSTMAGDIINSNNDEYIMSRIRQLYLSDSTVTIVLIGNCTWARRYIDWEIQSSLRSGEKTTPNGLLGIKLPSYSSGKYPYRLNANLLPTTRGLLTPDDCYARVMDYPTTTEQLMKWIEDAFSARTSRKKYIVYTRERYSDDLWCGHSWH
jgi:Thoeris protein ThsB, TIR-like domain